MRVRSISAALTVSQKIGSPMKYFLVFWLEWMWNQSLALSIWITMLKSRDLVFYAGPTGAWQAWPTVRRFSPSKVDLDVVVPFLRTMISIQALLRVFGQQFSPGSVTNLCRLSHSRTSEWTLQGPRMCVFLRSLAFLYQSAEGASTSFVVELAASSDWEIVILWRLILKVYANVAQCTNCQESFVGFASYSFDECSKGLMHQLPIWTRRRLLSRLLLNSV
jgi:hypothetical protein